MSKVPVNLARFCRRPPLMQLPASLRYDKRTRQLLCLDYDAASNPPILHRKETLLATDHPLRERSPG